MAKDQDKGATGPNMVLILGGVAIGVALVIAIAVGVTDDEVPGAAVGVADSDVAEISTDIPETSDVTLEEIAPPEVAQGEDAMIVGETTVEPGTELDEILDDTGTPASDEPSGEETLLIVPTLEDAADASVVASGEVDPTLLIVVPEPADDPETVMVTPEPGEEGAIAEPQPAVDLAVVSVPEAETADAAPVDAIVVFGDADETTPDNGPGDGTAPDPEADAQSQDMAVDDASAGETTAIVTLTRIAISNRSRAGAAAAFNEAADAAAIPVAPAEVMVIDGPQEDAPANDPDAEPSPDDDAGNGIAEEVVIPE